MVDTSPVETRSTYSGQTSNYSYDTPTIKRQRSENEYDSWGSRHPQSHENSVGNRNWYGGNPVYQSGVPAYNASYGSSPGGYEAAGGLQGGINPISAQGGAAYPRTLPSGPLSAPTGYSDETSFHRQSPMNSRVSHFGNDFDPRGAAQYGGRIGANAHLHTPNPMTGAAPQQTYLPSNAGHESHSSRGGIPSAQGELSYSSRPESTQPQQDYSSMASTAVSSTTGYYQPVRDPPRPQTTSFSDSDPFIAPNAQQHPYLAPQSEQPHLEGSMLNSSFITHDPFHGSRHASGMHPMGSAMPELGEGAQQTAYPTPRTQAFY